MVKKIKKIVKKKISGTPEKDRHFGIILEDINGKIQQIFEGQDAIRSELKSEISGVRTELKSEISGLRSEFNEFKSEMTEFKSEMTEFKSETKSNFETVFKYLSKIDDELQDIKKEIAELKSQLAKKADLERLLNLEKRVKDIEMILIKAK